MTRFLCATIVGFLYGATALFAGQQYPEGRRVVHLLEYITGDYPAALKTGSADEINEQLAFLDESLTQLAHLPALPGRPAVVHRINAIRVQIVKKTPADQVAAELAETIKLFLASYPTGLKVPAEVSRDNGEQLYRKSCLVCHGADGKSQTPIAKQLDPIPANFTDREKMSKLSPMRAFNTIAFGVSRTSMPSFDAALSEADRWDLAFYIFTLRHPAATALENPLSPPPLSELAQQTDDALDALLVARGLGAAAAAEQRAQWRNLATYQHQAPPLVRARQHLLVCQQLLHKEKGIAAADEALEAYLSGYEDVEPLLKVLRPELGVSIEQSMQRLPRMIRSGTPVAAVDAELDTVFEQIAQAEGLIAESQASGQWIPLSAAFLIMAREGLEAILVLAMLLAVLRKIDCQDQAHLVYRGAGAALALGIIIWAAAQRAFQLAAAHRETSEAVISLLAAALLYWAGLWMLSRMESQRWMAMIKQQLTGSVSNGSRSGVLALAFLAVFREVVETVLFFQALLHQYPGHMVAIVEGATLGVLVLAVTAYLLFVLGLKLPLSYFFGASSMGMLVLAVMMVGQAGAALGEAGFFLPGVWPFVDLLGGPVGAGHVLQILMALGFVATLLPHIRILSGTRTASS